MNHDLFPPKPEDLSMPDRVYETYEIMVIYLNSLHAISGGFNRCHEMYPFFVDEDYGLAVYDEFCKASDIIYFLLEESGRLKEWEEWEAKKREQKPISDEGKA